MTQVRREISGAWISVMATAAMAAAPTPEPSSPSESAAVAAATRTSECALVSREIRLLCAAPIYLYFVHRERELEDA